MNRAKTTPFETPAGLLLGSMLLATLVLSSCRSPVADHWGEAQHELTRQMVADPEATARNADEVAPIDGATTEEAVEQYRRDQAQPTRQRTAPSIINIGTGS